MHGCKLRLFLGLASSKLELCLEFKHIQVISLATMITSTLTRGNGKIQMDTTDEQKVQNGFIRFRCRISFRFLYQSVFYKYL